MFGIGHLRLKQKLLTAKVEQLEANLQQAWSNPDADLLNNTKATLYDIHITMQQLDIECANSRMQWTKEGGGDKNSKLFHTAIKVRQKQNHMLLKRPDDSLTDDRDKIGWDAVKFYEDLFNGHHPPR